MTTTPQPHDQPPVPFVEATRFEVSIFPQGHDARGHFTISIEWRGPDSWAVLDGPFCLGADGVWEYEPRTSERDDVWIAGHRFGLGTAQQLAKQAAPHLIVNGRTALEVYRRNPPAAAV
jgi:hypothetical protein